MMFRIHLKDPDGVYDSLKDAVDESFAQLAEALDEDELEAAKEARREKFRAAMAKFFKYSEYLSVELDTEAGTCVVIPAKD
jgi:hypothetical protein